MMFWMTISIKKNKILRIIFQRDISKLKINPQFILPTKKTNKPQNKKVVI